MPQTATKKRSQIRSKKKRPAKKRSQSQSQGKKKRPAKRRSGNGYHGKQILYFIGNFPFLFVVKIGITGNLPERYKTIDKTSIGKDFVICRFNCYLAWDIERLNKILFGWLRVPFNGSGRTERFLFIVAIFPFMLGLISIILEYAIRFLWKFAIAAGAIYFLTYELPKYVH